MSSLLKTLLTTKIRPDIELGSELVERSQKENEMQDNQSEENKPGPAQVGAISKAQK